MIRACLSINCISSGHADTSITVTAYIATYWGVCFEREMRGRGEMR